MADDELNPSPVNGAGQPEGGAAPEAEPSFVADTPSDDGFSPEERQQFEDMQRADAGEPGPAADAPATTEPAAPTIDPVAGADDDDDDDDAGEKPAAGAAPGQPGQPAKDPRKARVSLGKYLRTEERAKKLETELTTERERVARFDERMKILSEALSTPKGEKPEAAVNDDPEPDKEADIYGHNAWLSRQLAKTNERLNQFQQGTQAQQADASIADAYQSDAQSFMAKEPNFGAAYKHLMQSRGIEMAMYWFGKDVTDPEVRLTQQEVAQINAGVVAEEKQLAAAALRAGQSPAQRIFAMAKARGYRPAAPAAAPAANGAAPAGGRPTASAQPPVAAVLAPKVNVKDEIDRIKNGQDAAVSLSTGGGAPANRLTPAKLADMPQDQFNELMENMSPEEFQRLVEGRA